MSKNQLEPCVGCGLKMPREDGPTHEYLLSSPACWRLYGEVLAREFSDTAYWPMHRLTVDAYAVQHPGIHDRRAVQSVAAHLGALHLVIEKGRRHDDATKAIGTLIKKYKDTFRWLEPPSNVGALTIHDVWQAKDAQEHELMVDKWARSAWQAWHKHHDYIAQLIEQADLIRKDER